MSVDTTDQRAAEFGVSVRTAVPTVAQPLPPPTLPAQKAPNLPALPALSAPTALPALPELPALSAPTAPPAMSAPHAPGRVAPLPNPTIPPITAPVVPHLPTIPPVTPSAAPPTSRQLPQSTVDAMRTSGLDIQRFSGGPRQRRGFFHRWLRGRAVVTVVALLLGGVGAVLDRFDGDATGSATPSEWDARVLDFVDIVERERGLTFVHPVHVEFFPEDEFIALFDNDESLLDAESTAFYEEQTALYNATGLAVDFDAAAGAATVGAVSTLGFYSPEAGQIAIRGEVLTPAVRSVLVHELTHALQDQHFDLVLGGADDFRQRAIVEADASRVEYRYLDSLDTDAQHDAAIDNTMTVADEAALSAVPEALVDKQFAPYVLGPMLVDTVFARDGNAGVDALLISPPTELVLVNPWMHGLVDATAQASPQPTIPAGAEIIEARRAASMIDLLAMLDAWLPWTQARGAVDGWTGGGYTSYGTADGNTCASFAIAFSGPPDAFVAAIEAWSDASGSAATPTVTGNAVNFEACTRGAGASAPPPAVVSTTEAIYLEHSAIQSLESGFTAATVAPWQCFARTLIDDPSTAPLLLQPTLDAGEKVALDLGYDTAAAACGLNL